MMMAKNGLPMQTFLTVLAALLRCGNTPTAHVGRGLSKKCCLAIHHAT